MYKVFHDFETYSELDIKQVGAWRYSESADVICMSFAIDDGPVQRWSKTDPTPAWLSDPLAELHAFNSFFEYCIWLNCLKVDPGPIQRWFDTAAIAAFNGLPLKLETCGPAIGLPKDQLKSKRGKQLIQKLCKPVKGKRNTDPALLEELKDYCDQDVIAERAIDAKIRPMPPTERAIWELDQKINLKGVNVDTVFVTEAVAAVKKIKLDANQVISDLTSGGIKSIDSNIKIAKYVTALGYCMPSVAKDPLNKALADPELPGEARKVLTLRKETGRSSLAKFSKILDTSGTDGRIHGMLAYFGAGTGRWAGRLVQPQNLPRPSKGINPEEVVKIVGDPMMLSSLYESPSEALVSSIRASMVPSEGNRFIIVDYSAIEARFLSWLAKQEDRLEVFRGDGKIYEAAASRIFRVKVEAVDTYQRLIGKVAELALGFGGGSGAFLNMAEVYGLIMEESDAEEIKIAWRRANRRIVAYWYDLEEAAISAIKNPGIGFAIGDSAYKVVKNVLYCKLPSGRLMSYQRPKIAKGTYGKPAVQYESVNSLTRKWGKTLTWGGKLAENITQAGCRDLLAWAMIELDKAGYPICMTVHDEVIADVPKNFGSYGEMREIMCRVPKWAEGLPLGGSGDEAMRYHK